MQKVSWIEEEHLVPDYVHMMITIPPKHAVFQVIGFPRFIKGPVHLARIYEEHKRNFVGQHFWTQGISSIRGQGRSGDPGVHSEPGE